MRYSLDVLVRALYQTHRRPRAQVIKKCPRDQRLQGVTLRHRAGIIWNNLTKFGWYIRAC